MAGRSGSARVRRAGLAETAAAVQALEAIRRERTIDASQVGGSSGQAARVADQLP